MAKKNFLKGFDALLEDEIDVTPRKTSHISKEKKESIRSTFYIDLDIREALKNISYWERKSLKSIVNVAFKNYIDDYIKNNGSIKQRLTEEEN